ncbi:hypothetical protein PIB30_070326 [Stylosanthes scabra]|uniref:Uncharacterized protein n=1 Tax=Stylosanthes scabra TaxID=79078 RepID=A0ABU6QP17_9FABA|nr:hypothetical protein [Stylosanthes scabra]
MAPSANGHHHLPLTRERRRKQGRITSPCSREPLSLSLAVKSEPLSEKEDATASAALSTIVTVAQCPPPSPLACCHQIGVLATTAVLLRLEPPPTPVATAIFETVWVIDKQGGSSEFVADLKFRLYFMQSEASTFRRDSVEILLKPRGQLETDLPEVSEPFQVDTTNPARLVPETQPSDTLRNHLVDNDVILIQINSPMVDDEEPLEAGRDVDGGTEEEDFIDDEVSSSEPEEEPMLSDSD